MFQENARLVFSAVELYMGNGRNVARSGLMRCVYYDPACKGYRSFIIYWVEC